MSDPGRLLLAATPIGHVGDASPRLVEALTTADVIAAEDTRRARDLFRRLGVTPPGRLVSHFEGNEAHRSAQLVEDLLAGSTVLVITDAGMPSVSDPGFRVVRAAVEAGVEVTTLPGPSAVLSALALSGLPVDRFCFEGFLPRKAGERARALAALAHEPRTMVFFEAPHRLAEMLAAAAEAFGADRAACVCRELTKTHEEVRRGPLADLAAWALESARGEISVVVAGAPAAGTRAADVVAEVEARVAAGERLRPAVAAVAAERGVGKNALYEAALAARRGERDQPDGSGDE